MGAIAANIYTCKDCSPRASSPPLLLTGSSDPPSPVKTRAAPMAATLMRSLRAARPTGCARPLWATRGFATTLAARSQPSTGGSKLFPDADAAVDDVQSGSTLLSAGFGLCGVAGASPPSSPFPLPACPGPHRRLTVAAQRR